MDYQLYFDETGELQLDISDEQYGFKRWLQEDMSAQADRLRSIIKAIENGANYQLATRQFIFRLADQEASLRPVAQAVLNEEAQHLGYHASSDEYGCGAEDLLPLLVDWLSTIDHEA